MYRTGREGSVWHEGVKVARVRDWSLTSVHEILPTTKLDDTAPTFRPGLSRHTGSCTMLYYRRTPLEKGEVREFTALLSRVHKTEATSIDDKIELELRVSDRIREKIRFLAWITKADLGMAAGELSMVNVEFSVIGHLLEAIR